MLPRHIHILWCLLRWTRAWQPWRQGCCGLAGLSSSQISSCWHLGRLRQNLLGWTNTCSRGSQPSVPVSYTCRNQSYTHELNELWEHLRVWNQWFLWAGRRSRLLPWQLLNSVLTFSHRQRPVTTLQPVCQCRLVPCLLVSSGMGISFVLFTLRLTQWCSPRQRGLCSAVQGQRTLD